MYNLIMVKDVRVRIAPSPTGFLHIGTARTALFNFLFAQHYKGGFVLRIEDTDLERSEKKYEEDIIEGLQWLGIEWDEFYRQSERLDIYKKYIQKLLDEGKAFWCYHSIEELEAEKQEQMKRKEAPRHICEYKVKSQKSKVKSKEGIIRLAVDENSTRIISFEDLIRGTVEWEQKLVGDLSIAKDENTPLYNLAVVVDDYEMKISHVIRGEDHISNTPKQILIQEALGFNALEYAHMPLILGIDRSKLSKRHGATSLIEFREQGYLPEAMINFMALLGWKPKHETWNIEHEAQKGRQEDVFNLDELVHHFDIHRVHKSGAVFDIKKLNWMNNQYIRGLPSEQFESAVVPFVLREIQPEKVEDDFVEKIKPILIERLEKLSDVKEFEYLFKAPEYDKSLLVWRKSDLNGAKKALELINGKLSLEDLENKDTVKNKLDEIANQEFGGDRGAVYWPLRVALTGKEKSPDPVVITSVLTKEQTLIRINHALKKLNS
ncbi:MAG: glutamate--tRNA ligase [Parcubacteria group bacterium]|nr:glutamate--tRNA ligase [Parcubacteria group bacterium]